MSRAGFPAISDPHGAPLNVITTVRNIRARIENLEAATAAPATATTPSAAPTVASLSASLNLLIAQYNALASAVALLSSSSSSAGAVSYKAAEPLTAGQPVYESGSGTVSYVDPAVQARAQTVLGIVTANAPAGSTVSVQVAGTIAGGFAGFSFPGLVYAGPGGILTQAPPTSFPALQVGLAISATQIAVTPDQQLVTWQVNGLSIGQRRQVDFQAGAGLYLTAYDDAANNRVVVTVNLGTLANPKPASSFVASPPDTAHMSAAVHHASNM